MAENSPSATSMPHVQQVADETPAGSDAAAISPSEAGQNRPARGDAARTVRSPGLTAPSRRFARHYHPRSGDAVTFSVVRREPDFRVTYTAPVVASRNSGRRRPDGHVIYVQN